MNFTVEREEGGGRREEGGERREGRGGRREEGGGRERDAVRIHERKTVTILLLNEHWDDIAL